MDRPSADLVSERLSALEEENRRLHERIDGLTRTRRHWRRLGSLIAFGLLLSAVAAGAGFGGEPQFEGERVVLRDPRRGSRRIEMGTQGGRTYLIVCDPGGNPRIEMTVGDDGRGEIVLNGVPLSRR